MDTMTTVCAERLGTNTLIHTLVFRWPGVPAKSEVASAEFVVGVPACADLGTRHGGNGVHRGRISRDPSHLARWPVRSACWSAGNTGAGSCLSGSRWRSVPKRPVVWTPARERERLLSALGAPGRIRPEPLPCGALGVGKGVDDILKGSSRICGSKCPADLGPRVASTPRMLDGLAQCLIECHQRTAALSNAVHGVTGPISRDVEAQLPAVTNQPESSRSRVHVCSSRFMDRHHRQTRASPE